MTAVAVSQAYVALEEHLGATLNQKPFMLVRMSDNSVEVICNN